MKTFVERRANAIVKQLQEFMVNEPFAAEFSTANREVFAGIIKDIAANEGTILLTFLWLQQVKKVGFGKNADRVYHSNITPVISETIISFVPCWMRSRKNPLIIVRSSLGETYRFSKDPVEIARVAVLNPKWSPKTAPPSAPSS